MKKPDSVPADLFKRAELVKHKDDVRNWGATSPGLPLETREAIKRASADRWQLLEIIARLETQLESAEEEKRDAYTSGYESGYGERYTDMVDDGWREPSD